MVSPIYMYYGFVSTLWLGTYTMVLVSKIIAYYTNNDNFVHTIWFSTYTRKFVYYTHAYFERAHFCIPHYDCRVYKSNMDSYIHYCV